MEEHDGLAETGEGPAPQTFTWPLIGALYGSLVVVAVVVLLASQLGRSFEDEVDAPARTLVAAPVVVFATAVFVGVWRRSFCPDTGDSRCGWRRSSVG